MSFNGYKQQLNEFGIEYITLGLLKGSIVCVPSTYVYVYVSEKGSDYFN